MKNSIRVIARIITKPGTGDRVKSVLSDLIEPTRQELGCISYELLQNSQDSDELVLLEEWEDRTALDSHTAASHTQNAEAQVKEFLKQVPPDVRVYQTIT